MSTPSGSIACNVMFRLVLDASDSESDIPSASQPHLTSWPVREVCVSKFGGRVGADSSGRVDSNCRSCLEASTLPTLAAPRSASPSDLHP